MPSKDKQIRGAKILLGRKKKIERPISKLCPIEFANEFSDDELLTNNVEIIKDKDDNTKISDIGNTKIDIVEILNDVSINDKKERDANSSTRNRRKSAVVTDVKLKYVH